jgi:hypothetical protein
MTNEMVENVIGLEITTMMMMTINAEVAKEMIGLESTDEEENDAIGLKGTMTIDVMVVNVAK